MRSRIGVLHRQAIRDERGAIVVMSLLFACFLTGMLWYVMGIADAVVFRDRMQEAADAVAFSAAVVHARGMNFIVILNLIMFALVALYLILAILTDFAECLEAVVGLPGIFDFEGQDCTFGVPCSLVPPFFKDWCELPDMLCGATELIPYIGEVIAAIGACCDVSNLIHPVEQAISDHSYGAYYTFISRVMPGLEKAQHLTAQWIAPWGAEAAAFQMGSQYGQLGAMVSLSLIPDNALPGMGGFVSAKSPAFQWNARKLGLPVVSMRFRAECAKDAVLPVMWIVNMLPLPGVVRWAIQKVADLGGQALADRYCSEPSADNYSGPKDFWYGEGPKDMYTPAKNGNDWMQVWGFILQARKEDLIRNGVAVPSQKPSTLVPFAHTGAPQYQSYIAQAEFYFDCDRTWSDDHCNGSDVFNGYDKGYATYVPHWRVRLRRVHKPTIATDLFAFGLDGILNSNNLGVISGRLQKALGPLLSKLGSIGAAGLKVAADSAIDQGNKAIKAGGTTITSTIDGNGVISTTIH